MINFSNTEEENQIRIRSYIHISDFIGYGFVIYKSIDINDPKSLTLIAINEYARKIFNFPINEVLNKRMVDLFPNAWNLGIPQKYHRFLMSEGRINELSDFYENKYEDKKFHNKFRIKLLYIQKDMIGVFFQDITSDSELQMMLNVQRKEFQKVINNMNEAVAVYQPYNNGEDFIFVDFNEAGLKIEKITKEQVIGRKVTDVFPGIKEFGLFEVFQRVNKTGIAENFPLKFYKDNRIQGWKENLVYKSSFGEIIAIYKDLTHQKLLEEKIESMSQFPEENPHPVFRITFEGVVLYTNRVALELMKPFISNNGVISEDWKNLGIESIESNKKIEKEIEIGKEIYLFTVVPIKEKEYVNYYGRNITIQKRLEQQISQSDKMDAIGRMASAIAHDFNNLLTIILGYTDLILNDQNTPEISRNYIKNIDNAAQTASKLNKELLILGRKQVFSTVELNLNNVLNSFKNLICSSLPPNIHVDYILADDLWQIEADELKIKQVVMNIVLNARDAMPNGGHITIETKNIFIERTVEKTYTDILSGEYILLSISDTGIGIPKEIINHIFEPFFTTKPKDQGTGLGLAIVYGIIKQLKGYIHVYSEVGVGTTFKIYLPRVSGQLITMNKVTEPIKLTKTKVFRILLVEDEEKIRSLLQIILKNEGFEVFFTDNVQKAEDLIDKNRGEFDILITDFYLPDGTGAQIHEEMNRVNPYCKVLYISGYTQNHIMNNGRLKPGINFLSKPFTVEEFKSKINEMLKN